MIKQREIKIKLLHVLMILDFKDHYLDYKENINGKQLVELSLMMVE